MYLNKLDELEWRKKYKYLLRMLLVAYKKSFPKKWLKKETPGVDECMDLVYNIYIIEWITVNLRSQKDRVVEN